MCYLALFQRNTFQAILVTNNVHSFIIYNYGDMEWTYGSASDGIDAQVSGNYCVIDSLCYIPCHRKHN